MYVAADLVGLRFAKGVTPSARRTFFCCSPRRARSDNFHDRRERSTPRVIALECVIDAGEIDEASENKLTRAQEKRRRRAARRLRDSKVAELDELQQVRAFAELLREQSQQELVILATLEGFETKVEQLAADPDIADHGLALLVEKYEIDVLSALAAA